MRNLIKESARMTREHYRHKRGDKKRHNRHDRRSLRTAIRQEILNCYQDCMAGHAEVWL